MSCINPDAPLYERARGLKPDSWRITATTRFGSTPLRAADCVISSSYFGLPVVAISALPVAPGKTSGCAEVMVGAPATLILDAAFFVGAPWVLSADAGAFRVR